MSGEWEDRPIMTGWSPFPERGTTFFYDVAGHNLQIYVTGKRKQVRVFLDHRELKRED